MQQKETMDGELKHERPPLIIHFIETWVTFFRSQVRKPGRHSTRNDKRRSSLVFVKTSKHKFNSYKVFFEIAVVGSFFSYRAKKKIQKKYDNRTISPKISPPVQCKNRKEKKKKRNWSTLDDFFTLFPLRLNKRKKKFVAAFKLERKKVTAERNRRVSYAGKKLYFIRWMRDKWSETVDDNPRGVS